jgi:hypothetical protein
MAATLIKKTNLYIGASTDTKPSGSNVKIGSKFYEYNTGKWYVTYNDGTNWVETSDDTVNANLQVGDADVSNTNSLPTKKAYTEHVFQNAATGTGVGTEFAVGVNKSLAVFISGTSTSRTVQFKGKDIDGNVYDLVGVKLGDTTFTMAISTTEETAYYFENIEGFTSLYINLSAVAGGNVTVKGKAVS